VSGRRPGRKPASRVSLVSWFNRRFGAKPPFTDPLGQKGAWTRFSHAAAHRVTRYRLALEGVGARPWRVALLADPHVGGHAGDVERMRAIVAETNALAPDLVLLLGDYLNMMPFGGGRVPPETVAGLFRALEAPAGVYAILGNHDWKYGRDAVVAAFGAAGIPLIDNRILVAARGEDRLALLGLEDDGWGEPDLTLFQHLPAGLPALVATHDPGLFHDIPPGHVVVAGHMHGGQIRWPSLPAPVVPSGRAPRRWASGHIRERGSDLIVSAGLGASGFPLRLGAPPEIVVVELRAP
jgi:predicted MPP superfamily phosphohydrolase